MSRYIRIAIGVVIAALLILIGVYGTFWFFAFSNTAPRVTQPTPMPAKRIILPTPTAEDFGAVPFGIGPIQPGGGGIFNTNKLNTDQIQFNVSFAQPSHSEGLVYWDDEENTLAAMTDVSGTVLQMGQEMYLAACNHTTATIANGAPVYISGTVSAQPSIALARANSKTLASVAGLATSDIVSGGGCGYVTTFGIVRDLDTSAFSNADTLYLSNIIAGALTNTLPITGYVVEVGRVLLADASAGRIFVNGPFRQPDEPDNAYGEIWCGNNTVTTSIAVSNTFYPVEVFTRVSSIENVATSAGGITVTYGGDYHVLWQGNIRATAGSPNIEIGIFTDAEFKQCSTAALLSLSSANLNYHSGGCLISIDAGQRVSLRVQNLSGTENILMSDGNLRVLRRATRLD